MSAIVAMTSLPRACAVMDAPTPSKMMPMFSTE